MTNNDSPNNRLRKAVKGKVYQLINGKQPLSFYLQNKDKPQKRLLYYDEKKGYERALRYARNHASPFVDDQKGEVIVENIFFVKGNLNVPDYNKSLQRFLDIHPDNGRVFEEVNPNAEAEAIISYEEMEIEARSEALRISRNDDQLLKVARVLFPGQHVGLDNVNLVKAALLNAAKDDPKNFMRTINNPLLADKADVNQYFRLKFLMTKNQDREIFWNLKESKKRLMVVPEGITKEDALASFLSSKEGSEAKAILKSMLD